MNEIKEEVVIKNEILSPITIPSMMDCKRIINSISFYMNEYNWDEASKYVTDLRKVVTYHLTVKGIEKELKKINDMFDDLLRFINNNFLIGNNKLKYDAVNEKLIAIINEIGNYGIYIGQENIRVDNPYKSFSEKIDELLKIYTEITKTFDRNLLDEFLDICVLMKNKVIPKLDIDAKTKYMLIMSFNNLIATMPVLLISRNALKTKNALTNLLTIGNLINEKEAKEMIKLFEKDYSKGVIEEKEEKEEEKEVSK